MIVGMFAKRISFEGLDCVGKSTQARLLNQHFLSRGLRSKLVKFPYDDVVTHRPIYWMLGNGLAKRYPTFFQLVQFVNKALFQLFVLPWLLLTKDVVVFDRWTMSAKAYGAALNASRFVTHTLNRLLMKPSATILITGPVRHRSEAQDTYEVDAVFQRRVYNEYVSMVQGDFVVHFVGLSEAMRNMTPEETLERVVYELWLRNLPSKSVDPVCECKE